MGLYHAGYPTPLGQAPIGFRARRHANGRRVDYFGPLRDLLGAPHCPIWAPLHRKPPTVQSDTRYGDRFAGPSGCPPHRVPTPAAGRAVRNGPETTKKGVEPTDGTWPARMGQEDWAWATTSDSRALALELGQTAPPFPTKRQQTAQGSYSKEAADETHRNPRPPFGVL